MKYLCLAITILILICAAVLPPANVNASEGLPGSAKFGYGGRIDIKGEYLNESIQVASSMGFSWIAVEFDWEEMWPDPNSPPHISQLTEIINQANHAGLSVLLTISNPADWAVTERGPDPQTTANLILSLSEFYGEKILAIELFTGVNTQHAWKAIPDSGSYLRLLKKVQDTLWQAGQQIAIITTITPLSTSPSVYDIDDLDFLDELYKASSNSYLPIIGLKFSFISGDPYSNPSQIALRHYEEIRAVMLKNDHREGLIWITGFGFPNRGLSNNDQASPPPLTVEQQADWLEKAFSLIKAQLYVGSAFFDQINPNETPNQSFIRATLISVEAHIHPAVDQITRLINQNITGGQTSTTDASMIQSDLPTSINHTYLTILHKKYTRLNDFKHP